MQLKNILAVFALALVSVNADKTSSHRRCNQINGVFLESRYDPKDTRYGCIIPDTYGTEQKSGKKFCTKLDTGVYCYEKDLGNIDFCVLNGKNYNSRGCVMTLGYMFLDIKKDEEKRESSLSYCKQKKGMYLSSMDPADKRYACLLPKKSGDEKTKYCVTYDGKNLCYDKNYGNIGYCEINGPYYNGRGCALGLGYLYDEIKMEETKRNESRSTCYQKKRYVVTKLRRLILQKIWLSLTKKEWWW